MTGAPFSLAGPRTTALIAAHIDAGAQPRQLRGVHEAVLKDRFRGSPRLRPPGTSVP